MPNNQIYLLLSLAMFLWGANWAVAKQMTEFAGTFELIFWRFGVTSLCFLPIILKRWKRSYISWATLPIILSAALLMALYQISFFKGLETGLAGLGGILVTTSNPLMAFIITSFLTLRLPKPVELIGLSFGLIGSCILLQVWNLSFEQLLASGNLYFFGAALMWAIVSILSHKLTIPSDIFTFLIFSPGMLVGGIGHYLVSGQLPQLHSGNFWLGMFYMALFGTIFSSSMYFYGIKRLGVRRGSSFVLLVPGSAMLVSFFSLGEPLYWHTILGGTLAVSAVYLLNQHPD